MLRRTLVRSVFYSANNSSQQTIEKNISTLLLINFVPQTIAL